MRRAFGRPEKHSVFYRQIMREIEKVGINSFPIVVIISLFVGAVITIQSNFNIENPLLPRYLVGVTVRDSLLLEFSSTMVALILAGKVGSSITSELGMMKVSEQIDALEVMGINSVSFLVLPKIIASVIFFPILCLLSMIVGIAGGYLSCLVADVIPPADYIYGIQYVFYPSYIWYALTKTILQ
jgi:phospholipid/cholesterol/gamma-HCH transport system permease protein